MQFLGLLPVEEGGCRLTLERRRVGSSLECTMQGRCLKGGDPTRCLLLGHVGVLIVSHVVRGQKSDKYHVEMYSGSTVVFHTFSWLLYTHTH